MIKILFFIDKFAYNGSIGGAEKVLITLVNHMNPTKYDITVQTLFPDEFSSLLNKNIKYKYCYPRKTSIYYNIFRIEAQMGWVYPLHIKDDYDIEVAYLENESTKVMAASTNKKAKKIAWVHCDFDVAVNDKEEFYKKTVKRYKKFDKIACVSEKCKESFISIFGDSPEAVVVYNTIDDKEIHEKSEQQLPDGVNKRKFTLCTVGNMTPPKNHIRLLKTVHRLHKDGFDFDLWMVGDGEIRAQIEVYIAENDMNAYVSLFGFQRNPYPFMKAADWLVCSSNFEGFSTFISEGLILGKPIITTECSGMLELLGDSEYGIIVPNNDENFYKGLKKIVSYSEKQTQDYAEKSCLRGEMFSTDYLVKETESFLENLLD